VIVGAAGLVPAAPAHLLAIARGASLCAAGRQADANALLTSTPEGRCDFIRADLRDTGTVLAQAARTLDFTAPIALIMVQVLHFVPDSDDPYGIVRRLMEPLAPGSFLVIAHGPSDQDPAAGAAIEQAYRASGMQLRLRSGVARKP
jgi:hypothetical protein